MNQSLMLPSNRKFGVFFSIIFSVAALYFYSKSMVSIAVALSILAFIIFCFALCSPIKLHPFNVAWAQFGLLLGKLVNPIVLGAIFFLIITPIAIVGRIFGRDPLKMKIDCAGTHWKRRDAKILQPDSFKKQF